jgi:Tfp pilus assembly protein PilV
MSLLEVMIGVMLVMIVFLGIARLLAVGVRSAHRSKVATSTVTLAQQGIEQIQSLTFANIVTPATPAYIDQFGNSADPANQTPYASADPRVRFIRTVTVTDLSAKEKEITVTVQARRAVYGTSADTTTFTTRRMKFS